MLAVTVSGAYSTSIWADENENVVYEDYGDAPEIVDEPASLNDEGPIVGEGYHLETNTHNLSISRIVQGTAVEYTCITVTNRSSRAVSLIWHETDPYNMLRVDAPNVCILQPGTCAEFWILPNTSLSPGTYNATLMFADASDPMYVYGETVNVSMNIVSEDPVARNISIAPNNVDVATGSNIQFAATVTGDNNPSNDVSWSISGQNSGNTTIDGNGFMRIDPSESARSITVTATSRQTPSVSGTTRVNIIDTDYTLTVQADPAEGGNVNGGGTVRRGGSMTILAAPNISYQFQGWYKDGNKVSDQPKYTIDNINSNMNLVAKFSKNNCYVTVKKNNDSAGEVTASQFVTSGGSLTLQASAKKGWQFEYWQENNKKISSDVKFNLTGITNDRTIVAVFSQTQYDINLSVNPSDTGKVSGAGTYAKGTKPKLKAEAYSGYVFKNWTLNGNLVSTNAELVIDNLSQDYHLVANFEKQNVTTYSISAAVCSNDGMISPAGTSKVQQGANMLYTITPAKGYKVLAVAVDNVQVGPVTSYTFTNVQANHSIAAAFAPIEQPKQQTNTATATTTTTNKKTTTSKATEADFNKTADANRPKDRDTKEGNDGVDTLTPEDANNFYNQTVVDNDGLSDGMYTEEETEEATGLYQELDVTREDIQAISEEKGDDWKEISLHAIMDGYLQVAIYDDFDNAEGITGGNFITNPYLPNATEVVASIMNDDDIHNIMAGNQVKVNINIYDNTGYIDPIDKADIDEHLTKKMHVGRYFEVIMMKTANDETQTITETPVGLKMCMTIPEDLRGDGREFYVIRKHANGDGTFQVSILPDEDKDPATITVTTDKFSAYAMAYEDGKTSSGKIIIIVLIAVVAVLALILAIVIGSSMAAAKRRKRRRQNHSK